jgi:hypothetical protein
VHLVLLDRAVSGSIVHLEVFVRVMARDYHWKQPRFVFGSAVVVSVEMV